MNTCTQCDRLHRQVKRLRVAHLDPMPMAQLRELRQKANSYRYQEFCETEIDALLDEILRLRHKVNVMRAQRETDVARKANGIVEERLRATFDQREHIISELKNALAMSQADVCALNANGEMVTKAREAAARGDVDGVLEAIGVVR